MKTKVFVSSSIEDLAIIREAVHDIIEELGHQPVMSEFGEISYASYSSIEDECYSEIAQSDFAIILIGRRYGFISKNGLSVTHNEYRSAKENHVPILFLIDNECLEKKKIFEEQKRKGIIIEFESLQNADKIFGFIDEFKDELTNNGYIKYSSINEIRENIKVQMSHLLSALLKNKKESMNSKVLDILAEIKTLKDAIKPATYETPSYQNHYVIIRYLISDENKTFSYLFNCLYKPIEKCIDPIEKNDTFDDFILDEEIEFEIEEFQQPDPFYLEDGVRPNSYATAEKLYPLDWENPSNQMISFTVNEKTKKVRMNTLTKNYFDWKYRHLKAIVDFS